MQNLINKLSFKNVTFFLCCFLSVTLAGCAKDEVVEPEPEPVSYVSFYQSSPDAPDLNIYIDNRLANNQAFKYTSYYTYSRFIPGTYRFKFTPANASNAYIDTALTFQEDKIYSIFTVNKFQDIDVLIVKDSLVAPNSGKASIRVINLSPDAPALDLVTTGTSGTSQFANVDFKENTLFKEINGGTHSFQIREAGKSDVMLSIPNQALQAGGVYTFLVRGLITPSSGNTNILSLQVIRNL